MLRSIAILCALGCLVLNFPTLASSGTGFAIANGSLIITNFHVIRGCTTVTIPNIGSGVIKATDPNVDVAVIEPERPVSASLHFRSRYSPLKLGEEIIVIGFPLKGLLSSTPTVTTGIVSSLAGIRDDVTRLQITAPIQPGNSGGPVLDRAGNVVGIAVSKLNALKLAPLIGDIAQNVNSPFHLQPSHRFWIPIR
jgi:S1-C subfamily serine protease